MKKAIALEILAILLIVAIVLASILSLTSNPALIRVKYDNAQTDFTFMQINLKAGQTATGSFNFTGGDGTTGFIIFDPTGGSMSFSTTHEYRGSFTVKATLDGYHLFRLADDDFKNIEYVNFEYSTITPILGLDPLFFYGLVMVLGVTTLVCILVSNLYLMRARNKVS